MSKLFIWFGRHYVDIIILEPFLRMWHYKLLYMSVKCNHNIIILEARIPYCAEWISRKRDIQTNKKASINSPCDLRFS